MLPEYSREGEVQISIVGNHPRGILFDLFVRVEPKERCRRQARPLNTA
jgi:hypothetical protein